MLVSTFAKGINTLRSYRMTENLFNRNLFDINAAKYMTIKYENDLLKAKTYQHNSGLFNQNFRGFRNNLIFNFSSQNKSTHKQSTIKAKSTSNQSKPNPTKQQINPIDNNKNQQEKSKTIKQKSLDSHNSNDKPKQYQKSSSVPPLTTSQIKNKTTPSSTLTSQIFMKQLLSHLQKLQKTNQQQRKILSQIQKDTKRHHYVYLILVMFLLFGMGTIGFFIGEIKLTHSLKLF